MGSGRMSRSCRQENEEEGRPLEVIGTDACSRKSPLGCCVADRWEGGTGGKNTSKWPNLGQPGDMEVKDRGG